MPDQLPRRDFLKTAAAGTLGLHLATRAAAAQVDASPPGADLFAAPPLDTVRIGFVGVGHQGSSHVENFLKIDGVEIAFEDDQRVLMAYLQYVKLVLAAPRQA